MHRNRHKQQRQQEQQFCRHRIARVESWSMILHRLPPGTTILFIFFCLFVHSPWQLLPDVLALAIVPSQLASSSSLSSLRLHITRLSPSTQSHLSSSLNDTNEQSSLILASDASNLIQQQLLNEAFSALNDKDKYETVLSGLCAKIIDGEGKDTNAESLIDPIRLLEEMNSIGITAGPRSVIGLIDATALTSDAVLMANVLSTMMRNGAISRYGSLQGNVTPPPRSTSTTTTASSASFSSFAFGNNSNNNILEQQKQRLESLPSVPDDDRATEVSQAVLFSALIASCVGINVVNGLFGHALDDFTVWTNLFLGVSITTVIVDNFFDVIVSGGLAVAKLNQDKIPQNIMRTVQAPKKEDMPLGIGTGTFTGSVVRGLNRLFADNTERDCQCEAAAVFVAYSLGLPVFAFRPNALEGAALVLRSMETTEYRNSSNSKKNGGGTMDSLASDAGVIKVLIWLMAPVAMELSKHPQLMSAEPREARGFVQRLTNKVNESSQTNNFAISTLRDVLPVDDEELNAYLRWALAEADALLRNNVKFVDALSEALVGGAATVGDCVAILEDY